MWGLILKTFVIYIFIIFSVRIMGKRQVGELQPSELVVAILISELATIPLQDNKTSLWNGIVPILTLVATEIILSFFMLKSSRLRSFLTGRPSVVIKDGKLCQKEMKKMRCTIDDLMEELRLCGVKDILDVDTAIMETNGQMSVFLKNGLEPLCANDLNIKTSKKPLPIPLIIDGTIMKGNLPIAKLELDDIYKILKKKNITEKEVFFMYKDSTEKITTIKREL
ncbi:MAG: DUF421 domain-containing protein [Ruminococcaceae bacterium]|nr:DUF421 domain-containing protein [Oscillospiraceae bacterium]